MSWAKPKFFDSAYFYYDKDDKPALKEGAPKALQDELQEFLDFHYNNDGEE
jgi:hypothetical protein